MADIEKVKRNIGRMIDGGASESEIDQYLAIEGVDLQAIKSPAPSGASDSAGKPWGEVRGNILSNFPASAAQFGRDVIQPVLHPIDTAKAILSLFTDDDARGAVGEFLKQRYGGLDNVIATIERDPVGFLADFSTIMTGGGALAARAPMAAAKTAGTAMKTAGRMTDPLNMAGKAVTTAGGRVASGVLGTTTGTGPTAVREAFEAGYDGGGRGAAFTDNMRGNVPLTDVIDQAERGLENMRRARHNAYRSDMTAIKQDPAVLDMAPILKAVDATAGIDAFKGVDLNPRSAGVRTDLYDAVQEWAAKDPTEFHTVEGLDALKRKIYNIGKAEQPGTPARLMADRVYNAVKDQITAQAPGYAKVMKEYEQASDQLREIQKTLSLNPNASVDTKLRKLQSVMRNNVNTNYGERARLVDQLEDAGASNVMPALAGQAMNTWTPRGLQNLTLSGAILGGAGTVNPQLLAMAPLTSPRIVGEGAHIAGRVARPAAVAGEYVPRFSMPSYQAGRLTNLLMQQ